MSILEVKNKVNELLNSWEEFKSMNDRVVDEYGKKRANDPITLEQLSKINTNLDNQQDSINKLQASLQRPGTDTKFHNKNDLEHKKAFEAYLRNGNDQDLKLLQKHSLSTLIDSDGGFFITRGAIDTVINDIKEQSPMRRICSVTTISTDALDVIEDIYGASAGWVSENQPRPDTKTPTISKKIIPVYEMYAQPKATQKLIDDANIDIEQWLSKKLIDAFARIENYSFINGDGIGKPKGILKYEDGKSVNQIEQIKSGKNGCITTEGLFNLYYSLNENFATKAKFIMSRAALQACRTLIDPTSMKYLWSPTNESQVTSTLFGCEIIQCADMPALGEMSLPIAFGDFSAGYQIVDRQGISILRDPFTDKPFIKFYATKRVGGGILNGQAIKLLKLVS